MLFKVGMYIGNYLCELYRIVSGEFELVFVFKDKCFFDSGVELLVVS